jgi:sugar lactone lactonase YvrE
MKRIFIGLTVTGLATILVPVSAQAGGLAFDASGNLFEASVSEIFKFTPDGTKSTFATGLKEPLGLTFDTKENLFVSDVSSKSIYKLTPDGKKSTFATGISPYGMALDDKGNLFVSDYSSETIFKFTPEGTKNTFASGLKNPVCLTFDGAGNLFVADKDSHSIFKFTPAGVKSTFASGLGWPISLICHGAGNLFVADHDKHSIFKFTPGGTQSTFASGLSTYGVYNLAFDDKGNLFVSDEGSQSIFKFTPDGTKSTFVSGRVSPDKQWDYQCSGGERAGIVKAGTTEVVLDLSEDVLPDWCNGAEVVWAPDSKRFALNYQAGGRYNTTAVYQLRDDKWVALRSPETDETTKPLERAQSVQLRKMHLPKNTYQRRIWDTWKVRKWTDANTAILYADSQRSVSDKGDLEAHFLFTLKFDADGNWKIVKTHQMSEKEIEKDEE